jgi:hypothetical protein
MNFLMTSVGLGCVVAVLAQTIMPDLLAGKFLETAAIASIVLILFAIKIPGLHKPIRGRE